MALLSISDKVNFCRVLSLTQISVYCNIGQEGIFTFPGLKASLKTCLPFVLYYHEKLKSEKMLQINNPLFFLKIIFFPAIYKPLWLWSKTLICFFMTAGTKHAGQFEISLLPSH